LLDIYSFTNSFVSTLCQHFLKIQEGERTRKTGERCPEWSTQVHELQGALVRLSGFIQRLT
jgi:hypothetical protein